MSCGCSGNNAQNAAATAAYVQTLNAAAVQPRSAGAKPYAAVNPLALQMQGAYPTTGLQRHYAAPPVVRGSVNPHWAPSSATSSASRRKSSSSSSSRSSRQRKRVEEEVEESVEDVAAKLSVASLAEEEEESNTDNDENGAEVAEEDDNDEEEVEQNDGDDGDSGGRATRSNISSLSNASSSRCSKGSGENSSANCSGASFGDVQIVGPNCQNNNFHCFDVGCQGTGLVFRIPIDAETGTTQTDAGTCACSRVCKRCRNVKHECGKKNPPCPKKKKPQRRCPSPSPSRCSDKHGWVAEEKKKRSSRGASKKRVESTSERAKRAMKYIYANA